ncbi:hypothetical protein [Bradymonas sediminis]|nr:hypothetical protein [Bradymonas sediminis]TDP63706.1 hypothetical protein DFR33_110164 [Bradymonas sediminis]
MSVKKWLLSFACAATLMGISTSAFAADFKPFTPVKNVCPECVQPKADEMKLNDGQAIRGTVVAENVDFYVFLRYGEVRAIPKSAVANIVWANGSKPAGLDRYEQVLLKNGHVLSGTIINDSQEPPLYEVKASFANVTIMAAKDQVKKAYRNGQEIEVK